MRGLGTAVVVAGGAAVEAVEVVAGVVVVAAVVEPSQAVSAMTATAASASTLVFMSIFLPLVVVELWARRTLPDV